MMGANTEAEILLEQWGTWTRAFGLGLRARSPLGDLLDRHMGRGVRLPVIADETALLIDAELARLRLETPELFRVLYLYHVEGLSFRAIGQEMGFSHSTARNRLRQATALAGLRLLAD